MTNSFSGAAKPRDESQWENGKFLRGVQTPPAILMMDAQHARCKHKLENTNVNIDTNPPIAIPMWSGTRQTAKNA